MKMSNKAAMVLSLGAMALLVWGCGTKKIVKTEVLQGSAARESTQAENSKPVPMEKYRVQKGDTLWAISRQDGIYSDSFQWPLIFKSNREQIQDPDQIIPGQVLLIQKGPSTGQRDHARQLAGDTPVFASHADPREPLPLNYF